MEQTLELTKYSKETVGGALPRSLLRSLDGNDFLGTTSSFWADIYGIDDPGYLINWKTLVEETEIRLKKDCEDAGVTRVTKMVFRDSSGKRWVLQAYEVAHRALSQFVWGIKEEIRMNPGLREQDIRWKRTLIQRHTRHELEVDDKIKGLLFGGVVSMRHPQHKPSALSIMEDIGKVLVDYGSQLKELSDPFRPLRDLEKSNSDASVGVILDAMLTQTGWTRGQVPEGTGDNWETIMGKWLSRAYREAFSVSPIKINERLSGSGHVTPHNVYPVQWVVENWADLVRLRAKYKWPVS